jgi:hypothetical protein
LKCRADVLIILDCCHAAAAFRGDFERTVELVAASGEREYTYNQELSFTNFFDLAARYLAETGPFTMSSLLRVLHKTHSDAPDTDSSSSPASFDVSTRKPVVLVDGRSYHLVPHVQPLLGSAPIILEPVQASAPPPATSGPSHRSREVYIAVVFHVAEDPSSQELQDLRVAMDSFSIGPGFTAKVLCQLKSSSTLLLVALPSPIYDCLVSDPACIYVGVISADDPCMQQQPNVASTAEISPTRDLYARETLSNDLLEGPPAYSELLLSGRFMFTLVDH